MAEVWLMIAERIADDGEDGPWICNVARRLWRRGLIDDGELGVVLGLVEEERQRQWVLYPGANLGVYGASLWPGLLVHSTRGRVVRIRFCAAKIRELAS